MFTGFHLGWGAGGSFFKFKREKLKEGESLEDLDHVLDMDDAF